MEFQRLKDKLGTRSLPSSEVEFRGALGRLVGEEGRGVPAIIRMVNHTRLDCLLGSTTGLRRGTLEAIHHARHRSAFGARLVDQPAMRNVLADLAIESEAATATAMRVARAYDEPSEAAFRRFATAVSKYWVSKRAAGHAAEALECLGGNGFVEDSGMPLLYRDAPLNSIWEGSGNVAALDVLRAIVKEPEGLPAFLAECELAAGAEPRLDAHLAHVRARVTRRSPAPRGPAPRSGSTPASSAPAAWWRTSPSRSRPRCSFATPRPRSPTPSARGASRAIAAASTGRCRRGSTPRRSSSAPSRYERRAVRRGRPGRADHAEPARARQRHHPRDADCARAGRRARGPGPRGVRAAALGQRQGLLWRLRPCPERRRSGPARGCGR